MIPETQTTFTQEQYDYVPFSLTNCLKLPTETWPQLLTVQVSHWVILQTRLDLTVKHRCGGVIGWKAGLSWQ